MNEEFKKIEPSWPEGERVILGYLLVNPLVIRDLSRQIVPEVFNDYILRSIYSAILETESSDVGIIAHEIAEELGDQDIIVQLQDFVREYSEDLDIQSYIDKLQDIYKRREVIKLAQKATNKAYEGDEPARDISANLVSDLTTDVFKSEYLIKPEEYKERRTKGLEDRKKHGWVPTGYESLDKHLTEGFAPGRTSIIAARTSMGKSTWKSNIIVRLCERGLGVLNVVPEGGFDAEADRIDAIRTGRELKDYHRPSLWDDAFNEEKDDLSDYIANNWNYVVHEDPFISFDALKRDIRHLLLEREIDIIFIDLLDRLKDISHAIDERRAIQKILLEQASIAKDLQVHFCNIVQIRRAPSVQAEIRKQRPVMEELKGSGAYEEIVDLLFLLYREGYYDENVVDDTLEICIEKQRVGPRKIWVGLDAFWESTTIEDSI